MHSRTEEVLAYLDTQHTALEEAVAGVPAALRERRPEPDRWSVAEILEHLAVVNGRIAQLLARQIDAARAEGLGPERDESPVLSTFDTTRVLDRSRRITASESSQPRGGLHASAAGAELDRQREAIRAALLSADGLALSEVLIPHHVFGSLNVYQWVLFVGGHEGRHAAQIRETAAELQKSA